MRLAQSSLPVGGEKERRMQMASANNARVSSPRMDDGDGRRAPTLAKAIYRELRGSGLSPTEAVGVASELLALVATEMRSE